MLTLKVYADNGFRTRIIECESVSVIRPGNCSVEITCHGIRCNGDWTDRRFDIVGVDYAPREGDDPFRWEKAIIENANGKTTEIIYANGLPPAMVS